MKIRLFPNENIYDLYPEFLSLEKFNSLLNDNYPAHDFSHSKILWALIMEFHPLSIYNSLSPAAKRATIEEEYLDFKLDWNLFKDYTPLLMDMCLTKAEQYLAAWEEKLDERQVLIASIPYSLTTYEDLDKLMSATEKMWKQYQNCLKDVQLEESRLEGGGIESPSEQGLM